MKIHRGYEPTGTTVADLIASAISHYRQIMKPLKTIYLHPFLYNQWEMFIYRKYQELGKKTEFEELREQEQMFQFDGVNIDLAHGIQATNLAFDFYE